MILLLLRQTFPGLDGIRARCDFPRLVNDPHFQLPGVTPGSQLVPALQEFAAKFRDLIRRCLEGEMRGIMSQIKEERLPGLPCFINKFQSERGPQIRGVPIPPQRGIVVGQFNAIQKQIGAGMPCLVETTRWSIETALESPGSRRFSRPVPHMPFSGHGGEIARWFQHFRKRCALVIQVPHISRHAIVANHVSHPRLMRIDPGEQGRAGRTTAPGIVKLREP